MSILRIIWNILLSWFRSSVEDEMRELNKVPSPRVTNYSGDCLKLVKHFEGLYLKAYKDPVDIWTIGYGHTDNVQKGMVITEVEAIRLLKSDLNEAQRYVFNLVRVPLSQGQLDALVSFTFNLGSGNLSKSTLLKKLNKEDYAGAAEEIPRWKYAGGRSYKGLIRRRAAEKKLFLNKT